VPLTAHSTRSSTATRLPPQACFPDVDGDPQVVADEITRVLALPLAEKPFRVVVDVTNSGVPEVNDVIEHAREAFVDSLSGPEKNRGVENVAATIRVLSDR
jgi:hypothetical protein